MGPLPLQPGFAIMRRSELSVATEEAFALLAGAPLVHVAGTTRAGRPVLRTVHHVFVDGIVAFHAAPAGEKLELLGREAVAGYDEIVAEVPSYSKDPERACPATTFYRSVQIHGRVEPITDPELRARVLQRLMQRFQPEGGHAPIDPRHADYARLYRKAVAGLLIAGIAPDHISGKFKLGQERPAEQLADLLEVLWRRGRPGVDRAIELCRAAHPERPLPRFLRGPAGTQLSARFGEPELPRVVELLRDQYWCRGWSDARIAAAHLASTAWVGARDGEGKLIASARAITDGSRRGGIYDVIVDPEWRGRGLGKAIMALLLDHPRVRDCPMLELATRDAAELYRKFGFVELAMTGTIRMGRMRPDVAPDARMPVGARPNLDPR